MVDIMAGLREVPNVHMVVVHWPIALLPVALGLDLLGLLLGSRDLLVAGRWCLWLGTIGAVLAGVSGLDGAGDVHSYVTDEAEELMERHMYLQLGTVGTAIALSLWRVLTWREPFPRRGRFVYGLLSLAMVVTLTVGSDLGGQMVYLHGVAVRVDADSLQGSAEKGHGRERHHLLDLFLGGEAEPPEHEHEHHDEHP
jgi:uncharacterized membrane protein